MGFENCPEIERYAIRATLQDVAQALDNGQTTSVRLVESYLRRIEQDNTQNLDIRAVLELRAKDTLLEAAQKLDAERKQGRKRGYLHGIPILLKDAIGTGQELGLQTTAGSLALVNQMPMNNATIVDRLIAAGAIILGKANQTVFLHYQSDETPCGWSPRGGQVKSVYGNGIAVNGSSTGSAVAVAAGFCAAALGTQCSGGLLSPAQASAVFCIKPTPGLLPTDGVMLASLRQDTLGVIGKSAWDLAAMLTCMATNGIDYATELTPSMVRGLRDYPKTGWGCLDHDEATPLSNARIIADLEVKGIHEIMIKYARGYITEDRVPLKPLTQLLASKGPAGWNQAGEWQGTMYDLLLTHEHKAAMDQYLADTQGGDDLRTLEDVVRWCEDNPDKAFPEQLQTHPDRQNRFKLGLQAATRPREEYDDMIRRVGEMTKALHRVFDENYIDVLLFTGPRAMWASAICDACGFPMVHVPFTTRHDNTPIGMYFAARPNQEVALLQIADIASTLLSRPLPKDIADPLR